jgi:hypothetical protein
VTVITIDEAVLPCLRSGVVSLRGDIIDAEANGRIKGSYFALDVFRRCIGGDSIEDKASPPLTDKRANNRELVCL